MATSPDLFFFNFRFRDAIDIIIVSYLFYKLYVLIRGTRAFHIMLGLLVIILVSFIADWLKMHALSWIISTIKAVWVIAFVILFQPEIRGVLAHTGKSPLARYFFRPQKKEKINEIVNAAMRLSLIDIGALIVLTRENSLENFINTGTSLKAVVSSELLITIFIPKTPLHDGAVIISEDMILSAGSILPLSEKTELPQEFGTRHRAGIGLTEETDAVVIIVSEETGKISLAIDGKITSGITADYLKKQLQGLFTNH